MRPKTFGISTPTSQQVTSNGNFGGKTGRISGCRVYSFGKILPVSHTKVFVQNQNIVKTGFVFPTMYIDRNAKILSGGFNDRFSGC